MPDKRTLIAVFEQVRKLLDSPDNDFSWSSWEDSDDALDEIDGVLARLRSGVPAESAVPWVLFAPTGPIQEVSVSSGWGDEFLALSERFDKAMASEGTHDADIRHDTPPEFCACLTAAPGNLTFMEHRGLDSRFAEISILICPDCGRYWLKYFYEVESQTGSRQWYMGTITPEQLSVLTSENAKSMLEGLDWYYYGGSYYDGRSGRASGAITSVS